MKGLYRKNHIEGLPDEVVPRRLPLRCYLILFAIVAFIDVMAFIWLFGTAEPSPPTTFREAKSEGTPYPTPTPHSSYIYPDL